VLTTWAVSLIVLNIININQITTMKIITKEIENKLAKAGYYGDKAIFKLFCPWGAATWVIFGQDPEEPDILYGVADLGYGPEAGGIYLPELLDATGPGGLKIERDLHFSAEGEPMDYFLNRQTLAGV
jgi:hypothetical protein